MARDPVCGMEVDEEAAKYKLEYEGKVYYFCCGECMSEFQKDPGKYLGHESKHHMC